MQFDKSALSRHFTFQVSAIWYVCGARSLENKAENSYKIPMVKAQKWTIGFLLFVVFLTFIRLLLRSIGILLFQYHDDRYMYIFTYIHMYDITNNQRFSSYTPFHRNAFTDLHIIKWIIIHKQP